MMANVASTSQGPIVKRPEGVVKLNASVWQLFKPSSIVPVPEVDIIFFHGLQLEDPKEAFWRTWLSRDNTVVWPKDWLSERFPNARILSVSYDSSVWKHKGADPYLIAENLIHDLIHSDDVHVGRDCPVILVGHSFGGILIKHFVLGCNRMATELNRVACRHAVDRINKFLRNCRGVFYYSTPQLGSKIADYAGLIPGLNVPFMNLLKTLSTETARINGSFAQARGNIGIRTSAIVESSNTTYKGLSAKVVEESSARNDIDGSFYTAPEANHFDVCKPKDSKTCCILQHLARFVDDMLQRDETRVVEEGDECQGLPDYPIGLESRASDIEKLVQRKATVIGISGMGGIGKTAAAKRVYNDISRQFQYSCFAENVKTIPLPDLEDWLLRHFHKSGTRMDGARRQWSDLKGQRTLIVLDDVDSEKQLSVLPKLQHFGEGSCIILTSRDQGTFNFFQDHEPYEVDILKDVEAKKLLCKHAFGVEEIPTYPTERNQLKEKVEAVVKKCNGLPLSLEVIGRYLRNETDPRVWEATIDKLTRVESIDGKQEDRVGASLRVSYDALAKEEQNMFIEAGTYFFGKRLDTALAAWSSISGNSKFSWKNLVRRSMVKEDKYKRVWVHEHLRDLSQTLSNSEIVTGSREEADKLVDQLNAKQLNAKTKILELDSPHEDRVLQLQSVAELKELKYLDLNEVESNGSGKSLPTTLSLLRWEVTSRSEFPITLIPMTSLTVLELNNWDVSKGFSEALGNLTNLRHLSLDSLRGLDHLPENFGNLSHLKYLRLWNLRLPALPSSFGNLSALEHLELMSLDVLELPESFGNLSSLVKLTIYLCRNLSSLPSSIGNLSALGHLALESLDVSELPESFGNLSSLVTLSVDSCGKLASLPSSFGNHLTLLKELLMMRCERLECLPDSFSLLSSLRRLNLMGCRGLTELGDSYGNLSALEDINLDFTGIERLPHCFSQLSGLQRLSLGGCERLKELGDLFGNLSALKYLDLASTSIPQLPESFGRLSTLEELECKFDQARLLPDNFCLLTSLRELSIESASLERLPKSLGELARLEELRLEVGNLNALPTDFGKLASLRNLYICSKKLEKLPDSFAKLSSLRELTVWAKTSAGILASIGLISSTLQTLEVVEIFGEQMLDGDDCVEVPESLGKLSSLESLTFRIRSLQSLPITLGELSSLRNLDMDCENLKELPDSLGMLSSLETLKIIARKLESLPQSIGQLHSLRAMELKMASLRCLPESIKQLSSLRTLVFDCNGHDRMPDHFDHLPFASLSLELKGDENVPAGIDTLSSLNKLTLQFWNVTSLPEELGELSSLKVLKINMCFKLKSLPESLSRLCSLQKLKLAYCDKLKRLPDSLGRLSSLKKFELLHCEELKSRLDSLSRLCSLRKLKLDSCYKLKRLPDSFGRLPSLKGLGFRACEELRSRPDSLGRPSSSQLAQLHGAITVVGARVSELTVSVRECEFLDELTMRRLGWVAFREGWRGAVSYRRKGPDNVPLGRVIQSTRALCYTSGCPCKCTEINEIALMSGTHGSKVENSYTGQVACWG